MKKIGEGYYYNVYKLNSNQVLKVIKNKLQIFLFIFFANKGNYKNSLLEYKNVIKGIPKLQEEYSKVINLVTYRETLGNPIFINEIEYKQDLIKDLRNINSLQKQEFIKVVYDYVSLLKQLWSFGISDSVFNFSINCGYNKNNKLILIDFNEIAFNKDEVTEQVKNQVWLKRASYLKLTKEKQIIFEELMKKEVTIESLNKNWLSRERSK